MPYFSKKAHLGSSRYWCWAFKHHLLRQHRPLSCSLPGFASLGTVMAGPPFLLPRREPGARGFDGLFPRLLLDPVLRFLSSSCFCTLSLSSEVGDSEQLERTLECGPVHRPPLERWTSRSWKPLDPGSFCTGSENRCRRRRSPSGRRGRYPPCRFSRVSPQGLVSKSELQRYPGNLKQMPIL